MTYHYKICLIIVFYFYETKSLTTTTNNNLSTLTLKNNRNIYPESHVSTISTTSDDTIIYSKKSLKHQQRHYANNFKSKKNSCNGLCPDPPEDEDLDRREGVFALIGSVWSITTGVTSSLSTTYGEDAKIEVPDMLDNMNDRVNQQLYLDSENQLYKGLDIEILLTRLDNSIIALNSLPDLINGKKWSKVTIVLTGPMGMLLSTMKKLVESAEDVDTAMTLTKKFKDDLYAISAAVERKQVDKALIHQGIAFDDINEFVLAL